MDHCIAFFRRKRTEESYRIYVTDALKAITDNTCRAFGGVQMKKRYADYMHPPKEETRSAADIIAGIKDKANNLREG